MLNYEMSTSKDIKIFWLDDMPESINDSIEFLTNKGLKVYVMESESQLKQKLFSGDIPDIVIQDLYRFNEFSDLILRGWNFYDKFLRIHYPQIKVLICSKVAYRIENKKRAEDFNLNILQKSDTLNEDIFNILNLNNFNLETIYRSQIIDVTKIKIDFDKVNNELIKHLSLNPKELYNINWKTFEKLVTHLLRSLGYKVTHTPLTRDGGVDIWAIFKNELGEIKYAIDAKMYSPNRLVGPEIIRAIYGVTEMEKANVGMIVTSSFFSPEAKYIAEQNRYRISLKDYNNIKEWIKTVRDTM